MWIYMHTYNLGHKGSEVKTVRLIIRDFIFKKMKKKSKYLKGNLQTFTDFFFLFFSSLPLVFRSDKHSNPHRLFFFPLLLLTVGL